MARRATGGWEDGAGRGAGASGSETTLAVAVGCPLNAVADEACDKKNLVGRGRCKCKDVIRCDDRR